MTPHSTARRPGGSTIGRLQHRSQTKVAGIRFEWAQRRCGPILRVVATWTDKSGTPRHTSFSVENHGLAGALDRAIAARTSAGAPLPDRAGLLARLRAEYETRQSPAAVVQRAAPAARVQELAHA